MFDLGFAEMLVLGTVALIVVGPKDLPGMFRTVGQFIGKAKGMAREFSSAMNAAADEAGVNEINQTIKAAANPKKFGADKVREASKGPKTSAKGGSETERLKSTLSAEREANRQKIDKAMAQAAEKRIAAEKSAIENDGDPIAKVTPKAKAEAGKATPKAAPRKAATKKTTVTAAKKTAAPKKAAPKKAAKPKTSAPKDAS